MIGENSEGLAYHIPGKVLEVAVSCWCLCELHIYIVAAGVTKDPYASPIPSASKDNLHYVFFFFLFFFILN